MMEELKATSALEGVGREVKGMDWGPQSREPQEYSVGI